MVTDGHEILPGNIVLFEFQIPGKSQALVIYGKTIRTFKREGSPHYISGVRFHDTSEEDIETLFDFALKNKNQ